ncbi:MAG: thiamine pyrophosphate-binding protein [Acidobacteriota bacterium]|nr:thiamine pyrophosphate-binding protein [Acidobacteriota bacterium]
MANDDRAIEAKGSEADAPTTSGPATASEETSAEASLRGGTVIARALKRQGVEHMFGIVGYPVYGVAAAAQKEGINYVGFRNEQAASYAAGAVGFLTGRPGACLAVSGPGMVHGIAGLANAQSNCWPMLLLAGANETYIDGRGAFQESPQVEFSRPYTKYAARPDSLERVPFFVEQAVRSSIYGRPGAAYIDLPSDIIEGKVPAEDVDFPGRCADPPAPTADATDIQAALDLLRGAERPLVIVGKGAAYGRAEDEVRAFIEATQLPFLPTPMGKGVIPDSHPLSVAPARSFALREADVVFLIGARFNWILHFGRPPRLADHPRVIQLDIAAEEISTNIPTEVALVGDARRIVGQLNSAIEAEPFTFAADAPWRCALEESSSANSAAVRAMMEDTSEPMGYYRALEDIRKQLPENVVLVAEGANTMDISRTVLPNEGPRTRLDAGSYGTMGVGSGFAIAAASVHRDRPVVAIQGDSAFGFSGMEVEVACRYGLDITWIVINNNGIGGGVEELNPDMPEFSCYTPRANYERVMEAFGGTGYYVDTIADLGPTVARALADEGPSLVNVIIDPKAARKPQKHAWLSR